MKNNAVGDQALKQHADAMLKVLNELVESTAWDTSNFLRVMGKKLHAIRDEFSTKVELIYSEKTQVNSNLAHRVALRSDQQEVYVALYSTDGGNLTSWEHMLANLPRQAVSRPVYANEEDIIQSIRSKENQKNEAYACVYVKQSDIAPVGDKPLVDRLGKPLLTLKDKSLSLENINRFVSFSGEYRYHGGRLISEGSLYAS